jgi:hypothetical protein
MKEEKSQMTEEEKSNDRGVNLDDKRGKSVDRVEKPDDTRGKLGKKSGDRR